MVKKKTYATIMKPSQTDKPIGDRDDVVKNHAGGYVFKEEASIILDRFLILGTEGRSFYSSEKELTVQNANAIIAMIKTNPKMVLDRVVEVSKKGLSLKNDTCIFVLALIYTYGDNEAKRAARDNFRTIVRIPTHLMLFIETVRGLRGLGRSIKSSIKSWYEDADDNTLEYHVVKYWNRNDWKQCDILNIAHPSDKGNAKKKEIFSYIINSKRVDDYKYDKKILPIVAARDDLFALPPEAKSVKSAVEIMAANSSITHEMIPTWLKGYKEVWEVLAESMPLEAMIRNLNKMTSLGMFSDKGSEFTRKIVNRITDSENLKRARIHPFKIFVAKNTYESGRGDLGSLTWEPSGAIVGALDRAFVKSFEYTDRIENKRILVAVDSSGSMRTNKTLGQSCSVVAAAMSYIYMKICDNVDFLTYDTRCAEVNGVHDGMSLAEFTKVYADKFRGGGTDGSLPAQFAIKEKRKYDAIITFSDNETWAGEDRVESVYNNYRKSFNEDLVAIDMAMTPVAFRQNDPKHPLNYSITGLNPEGPNIIRKIIMREV